jgi:tryptophanyl-tRNA synthetase
MMTDPARVRRSDPGNPDICPVFDLHKVFTDKPGQDWAAAGCRTAGIGCVDCKRKLLEGLLPVIEPLHEKRVQLERNIPELKETLFEGSRKARAIAEATMNEVRQAMRIKYD